MAGRRRERRAADRGVVAVLSVFFVLLLLTILAVVINLGRVMRTRGDLQHAADSAALAAADGLDRKANPTSGMAAPAGRTWADFDVGVDGSAQAVATAHARSHLVMSEYEQRPTVRLDTTPPDVTFGFWHFKDEACTFSGGACTRGWEAGPASLSHLEWFTVNAVSVTARYPLPTIFDGIVGQGTRTIAARAIATTRRSAVPCALPFALSVCQLVNPEFSCGGPPKILEFTSADDSDPWALLRIDVRGVNGESPPVLRDFVRNVTNQECATDPAGAQYTTGVATGTDLTRPNLIPIIHGVLGIPVDEGGTQSPGACKLGRTFVVPVVQPAGVTSLSDCPIMTPPAPPNGVEGPLVAWPPAGGQRVVGYVNFKPLSVRCHYPTPEQTLDQMNCETQMDATAPTVKLANYCARVIAGVDQDHRYLRLKAEITCDAPLGAPTSPLVTLLPKLVQ